MARVGEAFAMTKEEWDANEANNYENGQVLTQLLFYTIVLMILFVVLYAKLDEDIYKKHIDKEEMTTKIPIKSMNKGFVGTRSTSNMFAGTVNVRL